MTSASALTRGGGLKADIDIVGCVDSILQTSPKYGYGCHLWMVPKLAPFANSNWSIHIRHISRGVEGSLSTYSQSS